MSKNELPIRMLDKDEKDFVKRRLLNVTSLLQSWQEKYNSKLEADKPATIAEVRKMILDGSLEEEFPDILEAKKVLVSFSNDHVESIGGPIEYIILCSFAAKCKSLARSRSKMISAELNIDAENIYEDLLQDAYASVLHAMYYFTKDDIELSTFILGSVSRSIERSARYKYAKLSPMSPEDVHDTYKCRTITMESPHLTVEDIAEEMKVDSARATEILCSMSSVVRISSCPTSCPDSETSYDIIEQIQDRTCSIEDSDNIDTVEFLKKIFDESDEEILSLTKEEKDVLKAACFYNFDRGWQSSFAKQYINRSTGKPYTRARIGQIYSSAKEKVRLLAAGMI